AVRPGRPTGHLARRRRQLERDRGIEAGAVGESAQRAAAERYGGVCEVDVAGDLDRLREVEDGVVGEWVVAILDPEPADKVAGLLLGWLGRVLRIRCDRSSLEGGHPRDQLEDRARHVPPLGGPVEQR